MLYTDLDSDLLADIPRSLPLSLPPSIPPSLSLSLSLSRALCTFGTSTGTGIVWIFGTFGAIGTFEAQQISKKETNKRFCRILQQESFRVKMAIINSSLRASVIVSTTAISASSTGNSSVSTCGRIRLKVRAFKAFKKERLKHSVAPRPQQN